MKVLGLGHLTGQQSGSRLHGTWRKRKVKVESEGRPDGTFHRDRESEKRQGRERGLERKRRGHVASQ